MGMIDRDRQANMITTAGKNCNRGQNYATREFTPRCYDSTYRLATNLLHLTTRKDSTCCAERC